MKDKDLSMFVCARLNDGNTQCDCSDEHLRRIWGPEDIHKRSLPMFKSLGRVRNLNERLEQINQEINQKKAEKAEQERIRQENEMLEQALKPYPHRWGVKPPPGPCCWKDCHSNDEERLLAFVREFKKARGIIDPEEIVTNPLPENETFLEEDKPPCECDDFLNIFEPGRPNLRPLVTTNGCNCGQLINWMQLQIHNSTPKMIELIKPNEFIKEMKCVEWLSPCPYAPPISKDQSCPFPTCCPEIQTCTSPEPCIPLPLCQLPPEERAECSNYCEPIPPPPKPQNPQYQKMTVYLPRNK